MIVYCVTVFVKPGHAEDFSKATLVNAKNTRKEPKNHRFDVLQSADDPNQFFLYEVYSDPSGVDEHKETDHYKKWRETVEPWMVKPRVGIKHTPHFPTSPEDF